MSHLNRIHELKTQLPQEHQDIAHYAEHTLKTIEEMEEQHRKLTAAYALQGYKINGNEEQVFYETLQKLRDYLVDTLEKTVQDYTHKGDKNWDKNFKDGVD